MAAAFPYLPVLGPACKWLRRGYLCDQYALTNI
jgi:hypothetical protein